MYDNIYILKTNVFKVYTLITLLHYYCTNCFSQNITFLILLFIMTNLLVFIVFKIYILFEIPVSKFIFKRQLLNSKK